MQALVNKLYELLRLDKAFAILLIKICSRFGTNDFRQCFVGSDLRTDAIADGGQGMPVLTKLCGSSELTVAWDDFRVVVRNSQGLVCRRDDAVDGTAGAQVDKRITAGKERVAHVDHIRA